jgi:hypothetical protein
MGRRVVEDILPGIGVLLGKVDLDQYLRTAGKEVDYTPSDQKVGMNKRLTRIKG